MSEPIALAEHWDVPGHDEAPMERPDHHHSRSYYDALAYACGLRDPICGLEPGSPYPVAEETPPFELPSDFRRTLPADLQAKMTLLFAADRRLRVAAAEAFGTDGHLDIPELLSSATKLGDHDDPFASLGRVQP